jgi:ABC-type amino acid transport substrate-binding protein
MNSVAVTNKAMRNKRRVHRVGRRLTAITLAWLLSAGGAAAQNPAPPNPDLAARGSDAAHLRGGWYPWDPYQYRDYRRDVPILTGFDVEIERALARIMSVEILLPEIAWEDHLAALSAGTADIAAGATASEARGRYAYFSKPYRTETDVLILPRGASGRYPFRTIEQMLDTFGKQKFRLGVVAGFMYADDRVNAFIADEGIGTRSFQSPTMLRTCEISWPASSTASSPTALPPPPQPGAGTKERASKSIRCASPPTSISC